MFRKVDNNLNILIDKDENLDFDSYSFEDGIESEFS